MLMYCTQHTLLASLTLGLAFPVACTDTPTDLVNSTSVPQFAKNAKPATSTWRDYEFDEFNE